MRTRTKPPTAAEELAALFDRQGLYIVWILNNHLREANTTDPKNREALELLAAVVEAHPYLRGSLEASETCITLSSLLADVDTNRALYFAERALSHAACMGPARDVPEGTRDAQVERAEVNHAEVLAIARRWEQCATAAREALEHVQCPHNVRDLSECLCAALRGMQEGGAHVG